MVGGPAIKEKLEEFWRANSSGRTPIIAAASDEAAELARSSLPRGRFVLLSPSGVVELLEAQNPQEHLKRELRRQVPSRILVPFNVERPAEGGMFFGRGKYLDRLTYNPSSTVLAGPGQLGKTSLLRRYRRRLVETKDPAAQATFYIDLYRIKERSADGVAQFIAVSIDGSHQGRNVNCERIEHFFQYWRGHFQRPVNLLLDEVDGVVGLGVLDNIEMAARKGYCRLVMAGRSELLFSMLDDSRAFARRMSLMRLEPLDDIEAEHLFLRPFEDLGIEVRDRRAVLQMMRDLTGSLPHLVQFYGKTVANVLFDQSQVVLDTKALEFARDTFETAGFFLSFVSNIEDRKTREVALAILRVPSQPLTVDQIRSLASHNGLNLSPAETWRTCNDLVIRSILSWRAGLFQVASGSLLHHARSGGLVPGYRRLVIKKAS